MKQVVNEKSQEVCLRLKSTISPYQKCGQARHGQALCMSTLPSCPDASAACRKVCKVHRQTPSKFPRFTGERSCGEWPMTCDAAFGMNPYDRSKSSSSCCVCHARIAATPFTLPA